jgi:hypothetical protein
VRGKSQNSSKLEKRKKKGEETHHLPSRIIREPIPFMPLPIVKVLLCAPELPDSTEEKEESCVGCGLVDDGRNVRDLDTAGGAGSDVD